VGGLRPAGFPGGERVRRQPAFFQQKTGSWSASGEDRSVVDWRPAGRREAALAAADRHISPEGGGSARLLVRDVDAGAGGFAAAL